MVQSKAASVSQYPTELTAERRAVVPKLIASISVDDYIAVYGASR